MRLWQSTDGLKILAIRICELVEFSWYKSFLKYFLNTLIACATKLISVHFIFRLFSLFWIFISNITLLMTITYTFPSVISNVQYKSVPSGVFHRYLNPSALMPLSLPVFESTVFSNLHVLFETFLSKTNSSTGGTCLAKIQNS